jgi:hypothetical protein
MNTEKLQQRLAQISLTCDDNIKQAANTISKDELALFARGEVWKYTKDIAEAVREAQQSMTTDDIATVLTEHIHAKE